MTCDHPNHEPLLYFFNADLACARSRSSFVI
jgi:hypothetical protein